MSRVEQDASPDLSPPEIPRPTPTASVSAASSDSRRRAEPRPELTTCLTRQTIEFLIGLGLSILLFRTFAAEAYVVPTGSMAPTLLGIHRSLVCTNCAYRFSLGIDEKGRGGRPICPNCGQALHPDTESDVENGDRLLVQKYFFDFRPPRRWEVAVFLSPNEPNQAYVKRVIGLPGEMIQVRDGDVWVDGTIARKPIEVQRGMRVPVFDSSFIPGDSDRFPRIVFRRGDPRRALVSGWTRRGTEFVHRRVGGPTDVLDWLDYRHWDPESGRYGSVRDFYSYNGGEVHADNVVRDLFVEADLRVGADVREIVVRLNRGRDGWVLRLPVDKPGEVLVQRDGRTIPLEDRAGGLVSSNAETPRFQKLEVTVFDRRLMAYLDGRPLFAPFDFLEEDRGPGPFATPFGLGIDGGDAEVKSLRLFRDIHYTSSLWSMSRRPFGVDVPYSLGADEYFVLGDNSPVSNDSRFWPESPVVRRSSFVGKPFLVHLPGRMFPLRVFGRSLGRIPDPREIRYIR